MFNPTEIIFAATDACNLHCPHCFVNRTPDKLSIESAKNFLKSCVTAEEALNGTAKIEKVGFSGGEPFLYLDFLVEIIKATVDADLLFDQIMTNGDWWKTQEDLKETLMTIYDAGYDGKIGLSYDSFHNQDKKRIDCFLQQVIEIFGEGSVNIQTVLGKSEKKDKKLFRELKKQHIQQYFLPQTFLSEDLRAWQGKKWFREDFCQGPGHILYIHPDGNIAPCCGFANENKELFIGTIDDSFSTVLQKAQENPMIKLCYETGLETFRKNYQNHKEFKGKCSDICSFCDWVCKNQKL